MSKQILLLKISLAARSDIEKIGKLFNKISQIVDWNLEDNDKLLRIETYGLTEELVAVVLHRAGLKAEKLY
ncbi:MAG: hypothetical protein LBE91_01365 [Tannerella sp.]|jgi:hypothetical protein|nr:hypothetical protein [Tannerella sp.]